MMRHALLLLPLLLILQACGGTDKQKTILGETAPGLGDLWAPSKEEKADDKWWDNYYGHKSSGD